MHLSRTTTSHTDRRPRQPFRRPPRSRRRLWRSSRTFRITKNTYDPENRLIAASGPKNATLGYDPLGRLAEVSNVGTRRMVYDGDALVEEYDGAENLLRRFIHGAGVDDPLVWYEGTSLADRRFLHADHQGSIVALSDAAGNALTMNTYDEYGVPAASNVGMFGYTGQAWVPELNLWYYKARFYSPTLGRFLQVDPIGYGDQINLYAYVGNDPGNKADPDGQQSDSVMDRRNQAMLQAMEECEGRGAACAAAIGEGIAVAGAAVVTVVTAGRAAQLLAPIVGRNLGVTITTGTRLPVASKALPGPLKAARGNYQSGGLKGLLSGRKNLVKEIERHKTKISEAKEQGGRTSSMESEMRTFKENLRAIDEILEDILKGKKPN